MLNKHRSNTVLAILFLPDNLQVALDLWSIGKQLEHYILGQDGKIQLSPSLLVWAERGGRENKSHTTIASFIYSHPNNGVLQRKHPQQGVHILASTLQCHCICIFILAISPHLQGTFNMPALCPDPTPHPQRKGLGKHDFKVLFPRPHFLLSFLPQFYSCCYSSMPYCDIMILIYTLFLICGFWLISTIPINILFFWR